MIALAILAILILISWLRIVRPGSVKVPGRVVHDAPLPLLARVRMHTPSGTIVILAAAAMQLFWDLAWWGPIVAVLSTAVLVAVPVRYLLTTIGIRCAWTPYRRWTEFAGVSRAPGGARLLGVPGSRDMRIWLSDTRGDDEFVLLLRRMITGAYKGQNVIVDFPQPPTSDNPGTSAASSDVARTAI